MDPPPKQSSSPSSSSSSSLFQVYLRLRPPYRPHGPVTTPSLYPSPTPPERFLTVEPPLPHSADAAPTQITVHPPSDSRKRAVEKFVFTKVFEEETTQLDLFNGCGAVQLVDGVLNEGRDGLLATLGVTGSGKSHTILGSRTQRGLTQLSLDLLFRTLARRVARPAADPRLVSSLAAADVSEAQLVSAAEFLSGAYHGDGGLASSRNNSRAQTPLDSTFTFPPPTPRRQPHPPPPTLPSIDDLPALSSEPPRVEHAVLVSMYEVYNDRIFDLLCGRSPSAHGAKDPRRRPHLLFKSTEGSPDRKLVAGLRKIVCASYDEAVAVLETGLLERRVAGTGSNAASSRSHGFFCVEVRRRQKMADGGSGAEWRAGAAGLTVVDLAGSERARNAKTAGATLAEAGKINESLMYLGQCLQMQSDAGDSTKPTVVPFRQCKLTELLFSNSFPASSSSRPNSHHPQHHHRNAQKALMIVTADPLGDFNATSQILRYSALAREVTVPRIPSVASTLSSVALPPPLSSQGSRPGTSGSATTSGTGTGSVIIRPDSAHGPSTTLLVAVREEAERLADEVEILALRLAEETLRRREAEDAWRTVEARVEDAEREVREEVCDEWERRLELERRRWAAARDEERDRADEECDRKIQLLEGSFRVHEDRHPLLSIATAAAADDRRVRELEDENAALRRRLDALERELQCRSPTKASAGPPPPAKANVHHPRRYDGEAKENAPAIEAGNATRTKAKTPSRAIRTLAPRGDGHYMTGIRSGMGMGMGYDDGGDDPFRGR